MLLGKAALEKLARSHVAVFGIGGVGSFAVEGLARASVGTFTLVDFDTVDVTNINRQIHATWETVGKPKVEVMKLRVEKINPKAKVFTHQVFYLPGQTDHLLKGDFDYIVDAVDTLTAKIGLVVAARELNIPIISSMGAGNKLDPTKFEVADIYETSVCPLAKAMRAELRKRGIPSLKVVYSKESPVKPRPVDGGTGAAGTGGIGSKRQIPGSVSFVPSVAGLIIAGQVVKDLILL